MLDGGKQMPKIYDGWMNEQIAKQASTGIANALAAGYDKIEVQFPPVPNLDEVRVVFVAVGYIPFLLVCLLFVCSQPIGLFTNNIKLFCCRKKLSNNFFSIFFRSNLEHPSTKNLEPMSWAKI